MVNDVLREEKMCACLGFLSQRTGRREVEKTGEANCREGGDDETNLKYVEFEGFQDLREKVAHSFMPQIFTEHTQLSEVRAISQTRFLLGWSSPFVGKTGGGDR